MRDSTTNERNGIMQRRHYRFLARMLADLPEGSMNKRYVFEHIAIQLEKDDPKFKRADFEQAVYP